MNRAKEGMKMPTQNLTRREIEVLTLTAIGNMRNEAAEILSVTEDTIKAHIRNARRKLHALNTTHAITIAMTLGLIEPYPRPVLAEAISVVSGVKKKHTRKITPVCKNN